MRYLFNDVMFINNKNQQLLELFLDQKNQRGFKGKLRDLKKHEEKETQKVRRKDT